MSPPRSLKKRKKRKEKDSPRILGMLGDYVYACVCQYTVSHDLPLHMSKRTHKYTHPTRTLKEDDFPRGRLSLSGEEPHKHLQGQSFIRVIEYVVNPTSKAMKR